MRAGMPIVGRLGQGCRDIVRQDPCSLSDFARWERFIERQCCGNPTLYRAVIVIPCSQTTRLRLLSDDESYAYFGRRSDGFRRTRN